MSAQRPSNTSNWYPTINQLGTPEQMMATLKQVLDQHYALANQVQAMQPERDTATGRVISGTPGFPTKPGAQPSPSPAGPPPGSGPIDSQLLGLRVLPVDPTTLDDGAVLTYVAKDGNLQFK